MESRNKKIVSDENSPSSFNEKRTAIQNLLLKVQNPPKKTEISSTYEINTVISQTMNNPLIPPPPNYAPPLLNKDPMSIATSNLQKELSKRLSNPDDLASQVDPVVITLPPSSSPSPDFSITPIKNTSPVKKRSIFSCCCQSDEEEPDSENKFLLKARK